MSKQQAAALGGEAEWSGGVRVEQLDERDESSFKLWLEGYGDDEPRCTPATPKEDAQ